MFLSGDIPAVCKKVCYDREAIGVKSNRLNVMKDLKAKNIYRIKHKKMVHYHSKPTYLDIRFGNLCNFKCRMCGPESSTSWYKDSKLSFSKTVDPYTNNIALWNDMPNIIPHVSDIYFAGGEPFVQDGHYKLLNFIIDSGYSKNINLQYNTNLSYTKYKNHNLLEMWNTLIIYQYGQVLKDIKIRQSIQERLNWNSFEKNVNHYRMYIKTFHLLLVFFLSLQYQI